MLIILIGKIRLTYQDGTTKDFSIEQLIGNKADRSELPTKTSDLENDSNFAKNNINNNWGASQTINGTLSVNGDIVQHGQNYESHAEQLYTKKDEIILRDGAIGGLTSNEFCGIIARLYNGIVNGRLGFKADGTAYVGDAGDEQPLLTRDDEANLVDEQVLIWDATQKKAIGSNAFVSKSSFLYDSNTETLEIYIDQGV